MPHIFVSTPIGPLRVDSDGAAVTRVSWVEDDTETGPGDPDAVCHQAKDQLEAYFLGDLLDFTVPVALSGSPLQLGVWGEMQKIPFGSVATYGDVAHTIDSEPQAVGTACGQNPIPIIVPCHRIVGAGGKLVGFSGGQGIETKSYLLDLESGQGRLL